MHEEILNQMLGNTCYRTDDTYILETPDMKVTVKAKPTNLAAFTQGEDMTLKYEIRSYEIEVY